MKQIPGRCLSLSELNIVLLKNCSLAFSVAERELGIPQLLDVDYVVRSESPDQFFIMTYVAQFYHKFSVTDSGYDSTVNNSFKYSSSEEDSPRKCLDQPGKRRGTGGQHPSDWKKRRPMGLGELAVLSEIFSDCFQRFTRQFYFSY